MPKNTPLTHRPPRPPSTELSQPTTHNTTADSLLLGLRINSIEYRSATPKLQTILSIIIDFC